VFLDPGQALSRIVDGLDGEAPAPQEFCQGIQPGPVVINQHDLGSRKHGCNPRTQGTWCSTTAPRCTTPPVFRPRPLLTPDPDLLGARRLRLGQVHGQHAVLALGGYAVAVDRFVNREGAVEIALLILVEQEPALRMARTNPAVEDELA